jgi:hypothetical protein
MTLNNVMITPLRVGQKSLFENLKRASFWQMKGSRRLSAVSNHGIDLIDDISDRSCNGLG